MIEGLAVPSDAARSLDGTERALNLNPTACMWLGIHKLNDTVKSRLLKYGPHGVFGSRFDCPVYL